MNTLKYILVLTCSLLLSTEVSAAKEFYAVEVNGQIIYTDNPSKYPNATSVTKLDSGASSPFGRLKKSETTSTETAATETTSTETAATETTATETTATETTATETTATETTATETTATETAATETAATETAATETTATETAATETAATETAATETTSTDTPPWLTEETTETTATDTTVTETTVTETTVTETTVTETISTETVTAETVTTLDYEFICSKTASWEDDIYTYPQDSNGWSIVTPDSDSRIVYVSSSDGDDSTAQVYSNTDIEDPFNPYGIKAFKTVGAAYAQMRVDMPDWILFKRGDHFQLEGTMWLRAGKSMSAHKVFASYGTAVSRPIIETNGFNAIQGFKDVNYVTVMGIEFYSSYNDPESSNFAGWENNPKGYSGLSNTSTANGSIGFHIENNRFNYMGITFAGMYGDNSNVVIRRNEVINKYSAGSHAQGLFLARGNGVLLEENVFDHNGWYQQRPLDVELNTKENGYATFFNHNVYTENSSNLIYRKNLFSRASSIGLKFTSNGDYETKQNIIKSSNVLVVDNLIIEGEVGISLGGNTDYDNGFRWDNINVVGNVLTHIGSTKPTNRNLSWNIGVYDWKSGTLCGNYMMEQPNKSIDVIYGIDVGSQNGPISVKGNSIINIGISQDEQKNDLVTWSENIYINDVSTNYLDLFLSGSSYESYISETLDQLQSQPYTDYYQIDTILEFMKSQALVARQEYISAQ